jgi:hypothetical protein
MVPHIELNCAFPIVTPIDGGGGGGGGEGGPCFLWYGHWQYGLLHRGSSASLMMLSSDLSLLPLPGPYYRSKMRPCKYVMYC